MTSPGAVKPYTREEVDQLDAGSRNRAGRRRIDGFGVFSTNEAERLLATARLAFVPAAPASPAGAWQKCPVCDGQGLVSRPPHIAAARPPEDRDA